VYAVFGRVDFRVDIAMDAAEAGLAASLAKEAMDPELAVSRISQT
jgi:hypothetical protein